MTTPRIIQVPFGPGLDKESGAMVVKPGSMLDLRNLYHHEGSLVARHGMEKKIRFVDYQTSNDATHILAGIAIRSERIGIVVSFYEPTGHVTIHRVDGAGTTATPLGNWPYDWDGTTATLAWPTTEIPKVVLAEIYGTVYFAHDERYATRRAPTWVYDPFFEYSDEGGLSGLKAAFGGDHNYTAEQVHLLPVYNPLDAGDTYDDASKSEIVRFRGVTRHLDYLVGWGWGNILEARPELVRISYPGEPRRFHPDHYWIAGDKRDPVINCKTARKTLLVFKETETFRIHGYSRATFGIEPYDNLYGCLSGRLARTVSGEVFFWSAEGPRVGGDTGPSQKIHLPLDLGGFEPATLVERTDFEDGWCDYIDEVEQLYFGFGRRLYCLSLRNPQDPRWAYWELARKAYTGFRLYGGEGGECPTGHPEINTATVYYEDGCDWPRLSLLIDNVDQTGEEYVQVWLKKLGTVIDHDRNSLAVTLHQDTDEDNVPNGWTLDVSNVGSSSYETTVSTSGTDLRLWGSTADGDSLAMYTDYTAQVAEGRVYRFTCRFLAIEPWSVGSNQWIKMEFLDSGDSVLQTTTKYGTSAMNPLVTSYGLLLRAFIEAPCPANAVKIRLWIGVSSTQAGSFMGRRFSTPTLHLDLAQSWFQVPLGNPGEMVSLQSQQTLPPIPLTEPGNQYAVAVRYVNLVGCPTTGYSGDPSNWPAASRTSKTAQMDEPRMVFQGSGTDVIGNYVDVTVTCNDDPTVSGTPGPKYQRDIELDFDDQNIEDLFIFRGHRVARLYGVIHIPITGIAVPVRARYLADVPSAWGPALNVAMNSEGQGTDPASFTIASPSTGVYRVDWAFATGTVLPDGTLKSIEIWDNYNDAGGTGEYRLRWHPCPNRLPFTPECPNYLPSDPIDINLGASAAGVTVSVKIRECYGEGTFGGWPWPTPRITYGIFSNAQNQLIAS